MGLLLPTPPSPPQRALWPALLVLAVSCGGEELEVREAAAPPQAPASARPAARAEPELPPREPRTEFASGLVVELVEEGDGRRAGAAGRRMTMHHEVRLADGEAPVESTRGLGIPFTFTLGAGEVVRGLDRALIGARAGDRLRIRIPAALAYGEAGLGAIPPDAELLVDVHVLRID